MVNGLPVTANHWTLDAKKDDIDMTMFGDANKVTFKGLPSFTGTFEGVFDNTETTIFTAAEGDPAVPIFLYPDATNLPGRYWCGLGYVDYNVDTAVADKVMVSGTWTAGGSWART